MRLLGKPKREEHEGVVTRGEELPSKGQLSDVTSWVVWDCFDCDDDASDFEQALLRNLSRLSGAPGVAEASALLAEAQLKFDALVEMLTCRAHRSPSNYSTAKGFDRWKPCIRHRDLAARSAHMQP